MADQLNVNYIQTYGLTDSAKLSIPNSNFLPYTTFTSEPPIPSNFNVTMYGDLKRSQYPNMSQARLRSFTKYKNANHGYINDAVAQLLITSALFTPVVGEYDVIKQDFLGHGDVNRTKPYGFAAPDLNFAWERHLDPDGIEREYACFDILLWTERYEEANVIIGKKHSMELNPKTIKGQWVLMDNDIFFEYSFCEFLGLCVLGDDRNPCFSGSAFYTADTDVELLRTIRDEIKNNFTLNEDRNEGGGKDMDKVQFTLSHDGIANQLWYSLNPKFNEEGGYICDFGIVEVFDESVVAVDYVSKKLVRFAYTKDETNEKVAIAAEPTDVFVEYMSATEKDTLAQMREMMGATTFEEMKEKVTESATKITEFEGTIATLEQDKTNFETTITTLQGQVSTFEQADKVRLDNAKTALVSQYEQLLDEETMAAITADLAKFSLDELEAKLAVATVRSGKFATAGAQIPNGKETRDPICNILDKYKK